MMQPIESKTEMQVDMSEAMGVMRSNMELLTEQEAKLSDLSNKSIELSDAVELDHYESRRLWSEQKWNRYHSLASTCALLLWSGLLYVFRYHLLAYFAASAATLLTFSLVYRFSERCSVKLQSSSLPSKLQDREDSWLPYTDEELGLTRAS
mmetsp:Transcript_116102/g.182675  ORF Transcript_116102/g.182675 Transcript_116102/m.182675 type:complete len:151 (+) Transcript_116102:68-520(+)